MVSATSRPATASGSSGHHSGSEWKPSPLGSVVKTAFWITATSLRKPYAMAAIGTPRMAASTSSAR